MFIAPHFQVYVPRSDHPLSVSVTPASGNPDLYVSRTVQSPNAATCANCVDPVTKGPCCSVGSAYGADTVTVAKPVEKSTYYIGVVNGAAATATTYTLVAHTGAIQLLPGAPQASEVLARQSVLYQFSASDPDKADLVFALSQNSNEYPAVMYITPVNSSEITEVVIPSAQSNVWSSTKYVHSTIFWEYMFTFRCNFVSSTFHIFLSHTSILILISTFLFVFSFLLPYRPDQTAGGFRGEIKIDKSHPKACFEDCTYLVAVYGSSQVASTSYTLSVSSASSVVTLLSGVPVNGAVDNAATATETARTRRYRAYVDSTAVDVSIDVTVRFGKADVLVARIIEDLTDEKAVWKGNHITISHTDPKFTTGLFFILVRGDASVVESTPMTSYSITLSTDNTLLRLGEPARTVLRADGTYFFFNLEDEKADIYLEVTPDLSSLSASGTTVGELVHASSAASVGVSTSESVSSKLTSLAQTISTVTASSALSATAAGEYTVYVSTDSTYRHPGPDTPADKVSKFALKDGSYTAILLKSDPKFCAHCMYFVSVVGTAGEGVRVTATTPTSVDALIDGVTVDDSVALYSSLYYSISLAQAESKNMTILVEPCLGRADLFVSYTTYKPSKSDANYRAEGQRGLLTLPIPSRSTTAGALFNAYTLAVTGAELPKGALKQQEIVYRVTALSSYKGTFIIKTI